MTTRPGYIWSGTEWVQIGQEAAVAPVKYQTSAPSSPATGDIWIDSDGNNVQYVWNGSAWTAVNVDLTQYAYLPTTPISGFRNAVINGGFDIWQRGTSLAIGTNNYIADRWGMNRGSYAAGATVSRQSSGLTGFQYCARVQRNSGNSATDSINIWQAFENVSSTPFMGKTVTISFYARSGSNYSSASSYLNAILYAGTGTDQGLNSMTGITSLGGRNDLITTTWTRYSFSISVPSSGYTQLCLAFSYTPVGTAGTNDYFEITGVQLEPGSIATPFEQRPIGTELALCQRYYYRSTNSSSNDTWMTTGMGVSTATVYFGLSLPVQFRTAPTAIDYSTVKVATASNSYNTGTVIFTSTVNPNYLSLVYTHGTGVFTTNVPYLVGISSTGYIGASAEL